MIKLKRLFNKRNAGGYTLVEVIIATALLGILIVGVLGFVTPVFGIMQSSDEVKKAERAAATMEHYIAKNLRKSLYIKVYTNAAIDDLNGPTAWIQQDDADFEKMVNFFDSNERKEDYTLRCLSIKYETDSNIRNSSTGATAQKYMLYTYSYDWATGEFVDPVNVFEECFYEDIYPKFSFESRSVWVNPDTNAEVEAPTTAEAPESDDAAGSSESGESAESGESGEAPATPVKITPAMVMDVNIYNSQDIDNNMNLLFSGRSFIEVNNVKNAEINQSSAYDYKIFPPYDLSIDASYNGRDIYIIYVTRNVGTDVAGG